MGPVTSAWPFADLVLRTPRLTLRPDDDAGLLELADRAREGIHDPATMPFRTPWTDTAHTEGFARGVLQHHWRMRAELSRQRWSLEFLVRHEARVVGMQELSATDFAVTREVSTGSWLTRAVQGRGLGTEMRAAVLLWAVDVLGAVSARSAAWADNAASRRISARLGYVGNGTEVLERRGERAVMHHVRLAAADLRRPEWTLDVAGAEACAPLLGA